MHSSEVKYKLDLHGETKEKAIQKLISFLDQIRYDYKKEKKSNDLQYYSSNDNKKQIMVTIVTGSGSHSLEGSILRPAIETVLKKRKMTYHLTHKKGAFNVDALSGIELSFDEQRRDSKIILLNNEDDFIHLSNVTKRSKSNAVHKLSVVTNTNTLTRNEANSLADGNLVDIIGNDNPSPSEVATFDKDLKTAMELSLKDVSIEQSIKGKESNELNRIMELSKKEKADQEAKEMDDIEKMMADAIELSKQSAQKEQERFAHDDDELQKVIEMSFNEAQSAPSEKLEQDALEYAIMISQRETKIMTPNKEENQLSMDEDERLLHKAIEMSQLEYNKKVR